ncbi:hypothetical protein [Streptomyces sp. NPDC057689]|uniref:hypothetical protein n=1 Tax=Streptomyces sp. NPDC057689 TaxID=3346213 RepID=UPI0036CBAA5B
MSNRMGIVAAVVACAGTALVAGSLSTSATAAASAVQIVKATAWPGQLATATCPTGFHLTGGGGDAHGAALIASRPSDDGQSWIALAKNVGADTGLDAQEDTTSWAVCSED